MDRLAVPRLSAAALVVLASSPFGLINFSSLEKGDRRYEVL